MKKPLLLLVLIFISFLSARSQAFEWAKPQGQPYPKIASDGDALISAGTGGNWFPSQPNHLWGLYIAKHSTSGKLQWAKSFMGTQGTSSYAVETDLNKNVIFTSTYLDSLVIDNILVASSANQDLKIFITKFNAAGQLAWVRKTDFAFSHLPLDLQTTTDGQGNVYISSVYYGKIKIGNDSIQSVGRNTFILKYDSNGNFQWLKNIPLNVYSRAVKIIGGLQNDLYVGFRSSGPQQTGGINNIIIKKFNNAGTELWSASADQVYTGINSTFTLDSSGNIYLYGTAAANLTFGNITLAYNSASPDNKILAKLSSNGTWKWAKFLPFGKPANNPVLANEIRNEINIVRSYSDSTNFNTNLITKLDTAGNILKTLTVNSGYYSSNTVFEITGLTTDNSGINYLSGGFSNNIALGSVSLQTLVIARFGFIAKILNHYHNLTGTLFIDTNANGIKEVTEKPFAGGIIEINGGQYYASTDSAGRYSAFLPDGNFNVSASTSSPHYTFSPQNHTILFSGTGQTQNRDFALTPIPNRTDVKVAVTDLTPARPGFPFKYRLTFTNEGTTVVSDSLKFNYNHTSLSYDQASVLPAVSTPNSLHWYYQNLQPNETRNIDISFTVNTATAINSALQASAFINPLAPDLVKWNNYDTLTHVVTGSFDPNDKQVNKTVLSPEAVAKGELLDYMIRFQNTGNDTAFTVVVRDSISANQAGGTFEMLSASHPYTYKFLENGIIEWRFKNILLPDSNRNEAASHGFIRYRLKPKNNLKIGDVISSRAAIYFDYNEPVYTNFAITTIKETKVKPGLPDITLYPNPARSYVTIAADLRNQTSAKIRLVNMLGQRMAEVTLPANQNLHYKLPLYNLPKGVYVIQLETESGRQTQRLVVQ